MGHPKMKIAVLAAVGIALLRLILFYTGFSEEWMETAYLGVVLGALIPLCLYAIWPRHRGENFLTELSRSMRILLVYSLIIVVFSVLYYMFVDASYFPERQKSIADLVVAGNPEENPEEIRANVTSLFTLRNFGVLLTLGFLFFSFFYSLVFLALKRLVVRG